MLKGKGELYSDLKPKPILFEKLWKKLKNQITCVLTAKVCKFPDDFFNL
jgi:hypothetical protein